MNLSGIPPRQKEPHVPRSRLYLRKVRQLPCVICESFGERQLSPTTAHHPICGRHSQAKRPDTTAIPLCDGHHQATFDKSKVAIHVERARWVALYGPDTDYIAITQDRLLP